MFVNSLNIISLHPSFSFEFMLAIYFLPNSVDKKEFIINFINGSNYLFRFSLCCFPEKKHFLKFIQDVDIQIFINKTLLHKS